MARKPNPTTVGIFILGGVLLVLAAVVVWGSGRLFETRYRYVCYFPGSVNGLVIGAPVKYRGVPIGTVVGMRVRFQQRPEDTRIPVIIEVSGRRVRELGAESEPGPHMIDRLVGQGLRARLELLSLVTGQLYVNLDLFPGTPILLAHAGHGFPEIPTVPTQLEEATHTLSALLGKLKEADVSGAARSLASAIEGIDRLVNSPGLGKTLAELPSTVSSVRRLARGLDTRVDTVGEELHGTLGELHALVAARGPVVGELHRALVNVQKAADALRSLAEFLQRNPNSILVGKKRAQ